ncbi:MAG: hypothetical protein ACE5R6_09735 [Candidatus Heimdallarchaeota archaeon]
MNHGMGGMFGFGWVGFGMLMMIPWFIFGTFLAVWVYHDVEARGQNGALWLVLVFFTMVIGFIIWLLVRSEYPVVQTGDRTDKRDIFEEPTARTPDSIGRDYIFCFNCDKRIPVNSIICKFCGEPQLAT